MEVKYTKEALKSLKKYDATTRGYIREKIGGLTESPPAGDIKPLSGREGQFRLRTGKYRIIYEHIVQEGEKKLMVNKIDSRGGIYKE